MPNYDGWESWAPRDVHNNDYVQSTRNNLTFGIYRSRNRMLALVYSEMKRHLNEVGMHHPRWSEYAPLWDAIKTTYDNAIKEYRKRPNYRVEDEDKGIPFLIREMQK